MAKKKPLNPLVQCQQQVEDLTAAIAQRDAALALKDRQIADLTVAVADRDNRLVAAVAAADALAGWLGSSP